VKTMESVAMYAVRSCGVNGSSTSTYASNADDMDCSTAAGPCRNLRSPRMRPRWTQSRSTLAENKYSIFFITMNCVGTDSPSRSFISRISVRMWRPCFTRACLPDSLNLPVTLRGGVCPNSRLSRTRIEWNFERRRLGNVISSLISLRKHPTELARLVG
jgi:hypothetical protein